MIIYKKIASIDDTCALQVYSQKNTHSLSIHILYDSKEFIFTKLKLL